MAPRPLFVLIMCTYGNIVFLLDLQGDVVERNCYTAFRESEILSCPGPQLATFAVANLYQYASKHPNSEHVSKK